MNVDDTAHAALQNLPELRRGLFLERAGAPERQVLIALLGAARLYTGVDAKVALFVVDPGKQCLKFVVSDGLSQQDAQIVDDKPIRPESPPCGRAACLGEKVIVQDISRHSAAAGCRAFAQQQSIGACWSFPIRSRSREILGALIVYFSAPHPADTYRIELMEFVAECAGITMERYAEAEERRKAEAQLRESESRYRSLTNVLTSVLWTTDAEGRFTTPQHTWEKYTGQSWNDHQGLGWAQAIHPEDRERVREAVSRALAAGDFYRGDQRIWHQESQTYRYCEARGLPIRGEQGEIVEWIGTCVDVDDQRRAEEALRTADRRKDEFIAVLAHELRNPLAPIRNAQGGLGIGLSLVRALVELHGGSVKAYSSGRDRGSEFVVRLPAMAGQLPAIPHDAIAQSTRSDAQAQSMRTLVPEDNNDAAETLSALLRAMGHEVRTAGNGQEAVDIAAVFRPTAALLDIGMPKLNGYQAAQRIRALLPDVSLIATTGWGEDEDLRRAVATGPFCQHRAKPMAILK